MKKVLIIGATSAIATAVARIYAGRGSEIYLMARDENQLSLMAQDLSVRGAADVHYSQFEAQEFADHITLVDKCIATMEEIDLALICHGTLPDQQECVGDFDKIHKELNVNALSTLSLLTALSKIFIRQNRGCIAVITSVAGDRGRQPNFIYGAAKSMVSTYLQGLRGSLLPHNVGVIDIKPGFVDTPMTKQFNKGALWAQPETIANIIVRSIERKKHTVYAPFYWRYIMLIVTSIPEFIFKRLKI